MKKLFSFLIITISFIYANDLSNEDKPLKTHIELSYVQTSGNTDTKNFATKANMEKIINSYTLICKLQSMLAKDDGEETSNKTNVILRGEKALNAKLFTYLEANYIKDKFSGYDYRYNIGPGLGYKILQNDTHSLKFSLGTSYAEDKEKVNNSSNNYASGNSELNYEMKINEQVKFKQDLTYSISFDNTEKYFATSLTEIDVKMNDTLSVGVSYKLEYQNLLISSGLEHIDNTFLTSLIIDF